MTVYTQTLMVTSSSPKKGFEMKFKLNTDILFGDVLVKKGSVIVAAPETIKKVELGKQIKGIRDKHDAIQDIFLNDIKIEGDADIPFEPIKDTFNDLKEVNELLTTTEKEMKSVAKNLKPVGKEQSKEGDPDAKFKGWGSNSKFLSKTDFMLGTTLVKAGAIISVVSTIE